MTAPIADAATTAVDGWDAEPIRAPIEAEFAQMYPEAVSLYFGRFTRKWWALVKDATGTWRHLEANGLYDLAATLDALRTAKPEQLLPARGRHARRQTDV
jgi:hypothetical protein